MSRAPIRPGDLVRICVNGFGVTPAARTPARLLSCIWTVESVMPAGTLVTDAGASPRVHLMLARPVRGLNGAKVATVTTRATSWVRVSP